MSVEPTVVVVGAASRDLVDDDPRGWRLGGGVSYSALTLARLGLRVGALIGADDAGAAAEELELLRDAGVSVVIAPLRRGPVFVNEETRGGRVQQVREVSDPVEPASLPPAWRAAGAWVFGSVAAELPDAWATVPAPGALVALGWQGLLRVLRAGAPTRRQSPGPSPIVARADIVGVGRDDLDASLPLAVLVGLLHPGATLLVTDGAHGGLAVDVGLDGGAGRSRRWRSIPVTRYVDPVGAGDTFLAGMVAARLDPELVGGGLEPDRDLVLAAAAASLVCEGPGLHGVPDRAAVLRRMAEAGSRP